MLRCIKFFRFLCNKKDSNVSTILRILLIYFLINKVKYRLKSPHQCFFVCFILHIFGLLNLPFFVTSHSSLFNLIGSVVLFPVFVNYEISVFFFLQMALCYFVITNSFHLNIITVILIPAIIISCIIYIVMFYNFGDWILELVKMDFIRISVVVYLFSSSVDNQELYVDRYICIPSIFFKLIKFILKNYIKLIFAYLSVIGCIFLIMKTSQTIKNVI